MRDFAKLAPQFWIGATGRKLHQGCPEATVVATYLISGTQSTMLGLYYLPKMYIAHETGLGFEGAEKGLRRAIEVGFCMYDDETEMVYVPEMARFQIAEQLEAKDNRVRWVQRAYEALPDNPFLSAFYEKYSVAFHLKKSRQTKNQSLSPLQGASDPLRSQEKEKEQLNEQEQEKDQEIRARVGEVEGDRGGRSGNGECNGTETLRESEQNQNLSPRKKRKFKIKSDSRQK
jgi:hypothetical protein